MKRFNGVWRSRGDNTLRRLLARPIEEIIGFASQDDKVVLEDTLGRQFEVVLLVKEQTSST